MKQRLANFELLRIISMVMIIELHLLVFSNTLDLNAPASTKTIFIWFMESLSFVAVNCYVLISGYFLVDSDFKIKRILKIWVEILFYSVVIYITLLFLHKIDFKFTAMLKCFFPFLLKKYWFCTIYIMLYLISPLLNRLISILNKKQYTYLIILILLFFSFWSTFLTPEDTINYGGGYSISWFICLYFIAGYLRVFYADTKPKYNFFFIMLFVFCSLINVVVFFIIKKTDFKLWRPDFLYYYYSITVLVGSVSLFWFFKNLTIGNNIINKMIGFFAPTTFGIYLMHENADIRNLLWTKFIFLKDLPLIQMIVGIIIIPICLFIILSFIDKIRAIMFKLSSKMFLHKHTKIDILLEKVEGIVCQK